MADCPEDFSASIIKWRAFSIASFLLKKLQQFES
jgi:hypothetical protein